MNERAREVEQQYHEWMERNRPALASDTWPQFARDELARRIADYGREERERAGSGHYGRPEWERVLAPFLYMRWDELERIQRQWGGTVTVTLRTEGHGTEVAIWRVTVDELLAMRALAPRDKSEPVNERAREVARNLVRYWETTGDSVRFHYEYEKDIAGAIAAYGREEAGKARHEMNQQIGEYLHQPANSKSTLQMLEDGLREERERALEQGFRFGWGASMSDMHWHEAIQKCRALAQRETQETLRCSDCGNVWHGQPPCPKCGSSGTMRVMDQAQAVRRPKIVCLCGSTKFKDAFEAATWVRTQQGEIVLSVGCFMHSDSRSISAEQKIALDELHKRKIDLADEVLVLNVAGYIGSSTRSEIEYAEAHGKPVSYLEAQANEIQQDTRRSADSQMSGDANRVEAPEPHPGNCAPALNLSADLLAAAREGCDKLSILAGNRIPITNLMVEAVAAAFRPLVERLEHQRADEFASMDSQNRELQAELVELRKPMACSVCAGTGVPFCGKPCICGGAGIEAEEIKGLRMELYKANERDRDIRERAERLERDFAREQDIVIALRDGQLKLRAEIVELRSAAPPAFTITVSSQDE